MKGRGLCNIFDSAREVRVAYPEFVFMLAVSVGLLQFGWNVAEGNRLVEACTAAAMASTTMMKAGKWRLTLFG